MEESSAYVAGRRGGPQFRAWTSSMYLLAALVNLTNAANRQRGGKRTSKPIVEAPKKTKARTLTVAELIVRAKDNKSELPL